MSLSRFESISLGLGILVLLLIIIAATQTSTPHYVEINGQLYEEVEVEQGRKAGTILVPVDPNEVREPSGFWLWVLVKDNVVVFMSVTVILLFFLPWLHKRLFAQRADGNH